MTVRHIKQVQMKKIWDGVLCRNIRIYKGKITQEDTIHILKTLKTINQKPNLTACETLFCIYPIKHTGD